MPESLKEEQELLPGGDIRVLGNGWVRKAWEDSKVARAPREGEVRRVVHQLDNIHGICILALKDLAM